MMSIDQELPVLLRDIAGSEDDHVSTLDTVRRRGRRGRTMRRGVMLVGALAATGLVVAALNISNSNDGPSVATGLDHDKVYVQLHTGANGATFGQLALLPEGTPATDLAQSAPDYIAVITLDPANPVHGYVKKTDLFVPSANGYEWSDAFLPIYAEDGTHKVGTLVDRKTFFTLGDDFTSAGPATIEPAVAPSEAWYDQAFGECVARTMGGLHKMDPSVSDPATAEVGSYDHATLQPTRISVKQSCTEQTALMPGPSGDLLASFYMVNGHITADYFKKIRSGVGGGTITQGDPVPFDEAQTIIAEQRKNPDLPLPRPTP
jgi:hypothetical protein